MTHPARLAVISILIVGLATSRAEAGDVQVNSYTTGDQDLPSLVVDGSGNSVVIWNSDGSAGTDSSGSSVQAQRYAIDGSPLGGEFQINTYTTGNQGTRSAATTPDGGFVVVWGSAGSGGTDTASSSVQGQRFASDGSRLGEQFQINAYTTGGQGDPSVATDADGDFVVVWASFVAPDDPSLSSVHGRLFSSDGTPDGDQFQVNTITTFNQWDASVAMSDVGEFVVVWESTDEFDDYLYYGIHARRYTSTGAPTGPFFSVSEPANFLDDTNPSVAMDAAGNFIIVWTTPLDDALYGQRFAADGTAIGEEFLVNSDLENTPSQGSVAMTPDGAFVAVWHASDFGGDDSSGRGIHGRRFSSGGFPSGDQFTINTYTTDHQTDAVVAVDDDGNFAVVWESRASGGTDTDGQSVQMRPLVLIFADGFESGDTSAWAEPGS